MSVQVWNSKSERYLYFLTPERRVLEDRGESRSPDLGHRKRPMEFVSPEITFLFRDICRGAKKQRITEFFFLFLRFGISKSPIVSAGVQISCSSSYLETQDVKKVYKKSGLANQSHPGGCV